MAGLLKLSPNRSLDDIIQSAAGIILEGGVLAYPTETFYGLGVDAANEQAIRKIFEIKGRNFNNPISVIIGDRRDIDLLARQVTDQAQKLMDAFWPGPLTIVFDAADGVSPLLCANTGKIGIRLTSHDVARRIAAKAGKPITATSANLSGAPECSDADDVLRQIGDKIDAVIDLAEKGGLTGSTIIDATSVPLVILRQGVISREDIAQKVPFPIRSL